jgi:hypothetical protein
LDDDEAGDFDEPHGFAGVDAVDVTDHHEPVVASEPEPEPELEPEPEREPAPAPVPPPRPRLGLGTFADLRGATEPRSPAREPIAPPTEPARPADVGETATPPPVADPDRPPLATPDRRPSFAEVADAVDAVAGRSAPELRSPLSEDLLPQRLPKRGRRSARLETPWTRERPAESEPATAPAATTAAGLAAPAAPPAPLPARGVSGEPQAASGHDAATNGAGVPQPEPAATSNESGERFAFFAAFRAAAEQAREEAGIDDRRRH